MPVIAYDKMASNFMTAFNASANIADRKQSRLERHQQLAEEAKYRNYQIDRQKYMDKRQADKDEEATSFNRLKMEQIEAQMEQAKAKNTMLEMAYTKKETIDYIQRYIDGGMKDNNLAKFAITGSDLKKQLYGDVVDVRDLNPNTDGDQLNKIVSELNANSKFDNGTPDDKSDDRPWTADDVLASNKYKVLVDSKGNPKVKNIDELLAATGYKNYIDTETWKKQLEILKLKSKDTSTKPTRSSGTMQVIDDYMEQYKLLHPKATDEELSSKRMEQIDKMTTKSFQAREADDKNDAATLVKEIPFEKAVSGSLSPDQMTKLQTIENGNKLTAKELKDTATHVSMLNKLNKGINQLSEQEAESIGIGLESIKTTVGKYFDPTSASDEEIQKAIAKITTEGTLGGTLAEYIKSMSGTAASDTERSFLKMVMSGGNYTSKEGRLAALRNFQDNATKNIGVMLNLYYTRAPATVARAFDKLDKKPEVNNVPKEYKKYF